jgi:hypothetical protein
MNREEFSRKWGWKHKGQVMFNMQAELLADLDSLSLPPAEGAEEILEDIAMRIDASGVGNNRDAIKRFYRDKLNTLATLHAQRIAEKMVAENLVEFGNMIRDEPNGDIPALAEYFMRTINLKSREK